MDKLKYFLSLSGDGEHTEQRSIALEAVDTFAYGVGKKAPHPYFADTMAHTFHQDGQRAPPECRFLFFGVMASVLGNEFASSSAR